MVASRSVYNLLLLGRMFFFIFGSAFICWAVAAAAATASGKVTLSIKVRESLSRSGGNSAEDVQKVDERASQFNLSLEPLAAPPSSARASSTAYAVETDPVEEYKQQILFGLDRFYYTTVDINELDQVLTSFGNMPEVERVEVVPKIVSLDDHLVESGNSANANAVDSDARAASDPRAGTPDYSDCIRTNGLTCQAYLLGPTPIGRYEAGGINAKGLHDRYPDVKGKNARIVSVEISHWLYSHEDLPRPWITHWNLDEHYIGSHDTESAGVMFAKDNGFGVTGIAAGAMAGYSQFGFTQLPDLAKYLKAGDIVQVGVQLSNGTALRPVESNEGVRAAIQYLVDMKGVHVIVGAGNGYMNIDEFDLRSKDSGSIFVGALNPYSGKRYDYSNWGKRLDIFTWGASVTTTDANAKNPQIENMYTHSYAGTSSANAVMAGGIALLQSIAFELGMGPIPPRLMREALVKTGSELVEPDPGELQLQPDLVKALEYLIREVPPAKKVDCNGWVGPQTFPNGAECDKICGIICSDKDNILACMQSLLNEKCVYPTAGGGTGSEGNSTTTTSTRSTTSTTSTRSTTTRTTANGGSNGKECIGVAPWSATKVYSQYNEKVVHNGKKYKQNFYNLNAPPAENSAQYGKPWILVGPC